jgi:hypothetical protein
MIFLMMMMMRNIIMALKAMAMVDGGLTCLSLHPM